MNNGIVGIDIADPHIEDFSVISMICRKCRNLIYTKTFLGDGKDIELSLIPKQCPYCKTDFKNIKIVE